MKTATQSGETHLQPSHQTLSEIRRRLSGPSAPAPGDERHDRSKSRHRPRVSLNSNAVNAYLLRADIAIHSGKDFKSALADMDKSRETAS